MDRDIEQIDIGSVGEAKGEMVVVTIDSGAGKSVWPKRMRKGENGEVGGGARVGDQARCTGRR